MIDVFIAKQPKDRCVIVKVEGHAHTAPVGQDTVCAAVSILVYGCFTEISELDEARFHERMVFIGDEKTGDAYLYLRCKESRTYDRVLYNIAPMERAIEMLAERYPSDVSLPANNLIMSPNGR